MKSFNKMPFKSVVRQILSCENSEQSIVSENIERVDASLAGFPQDCHGGLTRKACSRFPYIYAQGSEIKNSRQLTIVSFEELTEIARAMEIDELPAAWLGANIELMGIPCLTLLPPSTRLVFSSKATLVVDLENRPCVYPAKIIESHHPNKGRHFIKQAMHKRGVTAWVERAGSIECGDQVEVYFPHQQRHPMQVDVK